MECDFLIVGAGLSGAVAARLLSDKGYQVIVADRRNHIGGNLYDYTHSSGIRIHKYGPHYFRTDSDDIWRFVTRFDPFYKFEAEILSLIGGHYQHWPVWREYIDKNVKPGWTKHQGPINNLEDACLASMPYPVYNHFIREYNIKQWGCEPRCISSEIALRFEVIDNNDPRLKHSKYQGLPLNGYAHWFSNLLKDIRLLLNTDYTEIKNDVTVKHKTIYTGPIDEFFRCKLGRLKYRGQKRTIVYEDIAGYKQPVIQINYPSLSQGDKIRTLEWKHLMPPEFRDKIRGTVYTIEEPYSPESSNDYEYPFPDNDNQKLYQSYLNMAREYPDILFKGRLAEYKYLDMDKAIENIFTTCRLF